jgi:hypothetical protein
MELVKAKGVILSATLPPSTKDISPTTRFNKSSSVHELACHLLQVLET